MKRLFLSSLMLIAIAMVSSLSAQDVALSPQATLKIEAAKAKAEKIKANADSKLSKEMEKIELKAKIDKEESALKIKRKAELDTARSAEKIRQNAQNDTFKAKEKAETTKIKARLAVEKEINNHRMLEGVNP